MRRVSVALGDLRTNEEGLTVKTVYLALATGVSALALASAANAVEHLTLTEGSGWHYGESHSAASTSMFNYDAIDGNQFTLTAVITGEDDLSFVDGFVPGDVYSISIKSVGSVTYKTQFLGPSFFDPIPNLYGGPFGSTFGPAWLDSSYGHLQAQLSPGTYTITVQDLCGSHGNPACPGFPAGWGIRLDAVPELSTWALMLVGTTGLGAALRRRRQVAAA